jgi:hypothetical protein
MLLRTLAILLLTANVLFFSWARGWLAPMWPAPRQSEREPERVNAQVLPEAIVLLPAGAVASPAAPTAAPICMEAGPLDEAATPAAEAALAAAQMPEGSWTRVISAPAPAWLVFAGRVATDDARRVAEAELRQSGLSFELINAPAELAPGLVLSRHASRAAADTALQQLQAQGAANARPVLKGLRVVALPSPPPQYWLRAEKADAALQARIGAIPKQDRSDVLAGGFKPCAARP